jgi:hypothetical protein
MKLCTLLAGSLLLGCTIVAQNSDEPSLRSDRSTTSFVFVNGAQILPVAGRPFSARAAATEWKRNPEDGTAVTIHLIAGIARDSQGRIFREIRSFVPAESYEHPELHGIRIIDPVANTQTVCTVATRRCKITRYRAPTPFIPLPEGLSADGTYLERKRMGTREIDGLPAFGVRETHTTNAGEISTQEFWYSPDLQINVSITRKNSREGTQVIQIGDLSREEPDAALFQIPSGFVIDRPSAKPQR